MSNIADMGEDPLARGQHSIAARQLGSATPFGKPTRLPSAEMLRRDERILKHFTANTYKVVRKLYDMIESDSTPPGVRLAAISEYLTRALGKPVQAVDLSLEDRRPIVVDGALSQLVEGLRGAETVDQRGISEDTPKG